MSENPINKTYSSVISKINELGIPEELKFSEPLRKYTTWRVGGPADLFVEVTRTESLVALVSFAQTQKLPFFILGGGSNVLIGDQGFRGLVIRNMISQYEILGDEYRSVWEDHSTGTSRHVQVHYTLYTDLGDPSYHAEPVFVRVSSGYRMVSLIREFLDAGLTGLEKFSRIPGSLGGWIHNNVHGHTLFIGDFIHEVRSITPSGEIVTRSWKDLDFEYDQSVFHTNNEVILDAVLRVFKGNADLAKQISLDVIKNKIQHQPHNSGGCVFKNITEEEKVRNNFETDAVGYIVDKKLHMLGKVAVGGAKVSEKHGNFIETNDSALASDILAVIEIVRDACKKQYNITLHDEVFRVGEF